MSRHWRAWLNMACQCFNSLLPCHEGLSSMLLIVAVMVPLRLLAVVFAALARVTQVGLPVNALVIAAGPGRQDHG